MTTRSHWIDISAPVTDGMVRWPDNPPVRVERVFDQERGDPATVSRVDMSVHTGTHMDAPKHFRADGEGIEKVPIDAVVGRARVIELPGVSSVSRARLERAGAGRGERLLIKTDNSRHAWWREEFHEDFVHLTTDGAACLGEKSTRCVGVDYLSVAEYGGDAHGTHRALLDAGVAIIEGLNLAPLRAGTYELCCLPVRIEGADGAPARAVVRRIEEGD